MRLRYVLLLSLSILTPLAHSLAVDSDSQAADAVLVQPPAAQPIAVASDAEVAAKDDTTQPAAVKPSLPAKAVATERPTGGLGLGKMAMALGTVVAVVLLLGWVFKKLTLRLPGSRHIKIISTLPLGPKERLLVIEMQGKQRVLGVTAHSINLLFELDNSLPEEKLASDFHTQLQSFLKK